jgi:MATE family multidrug resistance protein
MDLRTHIKETLKLALPISFGQLGHITMGIVDSIMVGKVGYAPLAAAALVNGLFFLVIVLGIGMSVAATPLIAIAKGAGKQEECGKVLNQSLLVNLFFSFFLIIGIYSISLLIPQMNQTAEVTKEAIPYMQVLTASIIPFIIFQTYRQFLEGLELPNAPMVIALLANILNAFLNWIFIYGNFGVHAMGLFGAGIATTTTRWIMAISLMIFALKYKRTAVYKPALKFKPVDFHIIKKLIRIGLPSGFQYFLEVACFTFATIMVGWISAKQQAAHQIALNVASTTYMIMLGISSAGTIRVGYAMGKKDIQQIRLSGFTAIGMAAALMITFSIIMILVKNILPPYYNGDAEVISYASSLLILAAIFQLFDGLQASSIGALRGLTDVKIPLVVSIFSYWIVAIPIALILGFHFNLDAVGVWIGLTIGLIIIGTSMLFRFNVKSKQIIE